MDPLLKQLLKQLAIMGPIALLVPSLMIYSYWRRRYRPPIAESARENTYQPPLRRRKTILMIILALLLAAIFGYLQNSGNPNVIWINHAVQRVMSWFLLGLPVLVITLMAVAWIRFRDPQLLEITKRQSDSNTEELIPQVKRLIANKPTVNRYMTLCAMQINGMHFDDAMKSLVAAETLAKKPDSQDAARAMILFRLDERDRAFEIFSRRSNESPNDFLLASNYCMCLAEAGRREDALKELDRAEWIFKRTSVRAWAPTLKACRDKLEIAEGFEVLPREKTPN